MELTGNVSGLINLGGGGGGSTVEVTPILTSGEHIADIEVDGVTSKLYAPETTEPTEVKVTQVVSSGTKIASIEVDGENTDLYAPTPKEPTSVEVTQVISSGTKIASIEVDGVNTDLYAPEGGGGGGVEYSTTPHKVGKYVENNVEYDVWEVMLLFGVQFYGEEQHNLSYLNIYKLLDVRGSIKMNSDGGNWRYYSPFYLSDRLYDNYKWDDTSKILITLQATDMYGKVASRMITIRYIENVN